MTISTPPNCDRCVHRDPIPDSDRIACGHPVALTVRSRFAHVAKVMTSGYPIGGRVLNIQVNEGGLLEARIYWPFSFDAEFVMWCSGYREAASI